MSPTGTLSDAMSTSEAAVLALNSARHASLSLTAAWAAATDQTQEVARARIVAARSRIRAVPVATTSKTAKRLATSGDARHDAIRRGFGHYAAAVSDHDRSRELIRLHRIPATLGDTQRRQLLDGQRPSAEQLKFLDTYGVGAPGVSKLNAKYLTIVEGRLVDSLHDMVRDRLVAELLGFASIERRRASEESSLDDIANVAVSHTQRLHQQLGSIHSSLRRPTSKTTDLADAWDLCALRALVAARELAPIAVGLHRWSRLGGLRLRYRAEIADASLDVATALRLSLLAYVSSRKAAVLFSTGMDGLCEPYRRAARSTRHVNTSWLDGNRRSGPSLKRVRGIVESIDDIQVNKSKPISILRVRRSQRTATTVVVPFFDPRYVGIRSGVIVEAWIAPTADVLAEYTNTNTKRALAQLAGRYGGVAGGVIDRRDLSAEATTSWVGWLAANSRPMYDALPNSFNARWSLGDWFSTSVASGTLFKD